MNFSSFFRVIFRFKEFPPFTLRVILGSPSAEGDSSSRLSPSALFTTLSLEMQPALPWKNFSPRFPPLFRKGNKKERETPFLISAACRRAFFYRSARTSAPLLSFPLCALCPPEAPSFRLRSARSLFPLLGRRSPFFPPFPLSPRERRRDGADGGVAPLWGRTVTGSAKGTAKEQFSASFISSA